MSVSDLTCGEWQGLQVFLAEVTDKEPSSLLFLSGAVVCIVAALLMAKYRPVTFLALPLIAGFAAFCAFYVSHEVTDPAVGPAILQELGYRHVALVCICGTISVALGVALFLRGFGVRKSIWMGTLLAIAVAPFLVFGGYNAVDYLRLRSALKRATGLSQAQIFALAARCAAVTELHHYDKGDFPPEFGPLRPRRVVIAPGLSYASLYELGDIYFEFRIETTEHNQRIYFFTNTEGPQKKTLVWDQHPELTRQTGPIDRIITVRTDGTYSDREWIVLPDRLLTTGSEDTNEAEDSTKSIPLDAASVGEFKRLTQELKRRCGGRRYDSGITDGLTIFVSFSPSGEGSPDDAEFSNTWTDDLTPLLDALAKVAPGASPNDARQQMQEISKGRRVRILPLAESRDEHPSVPFWCVWRTWIKPNAPTR